MTQTKTPFSSCCKAEVNTMGDGTTHYYSCTQCNNPCDILSPSDTEKEVTAVEYLKEREIIGYISLHTYLSRNNISQLCFIIDSMEEYASLKTKEQEKELERLKTKVTFLLSKRAENQSQLQSIEQKQKAREERLLEFIAINLFRKVEYKDLWTSRDIRYPNAYSTSQLIDLFDKTENC